MRGDIVDCIKELVKNVRIEKNKRKIQFIFECLTFSPCHQSGHSCCLDQDEDYKKTAN